METKLNIPTLNLSSSAEFLTSLSKSRSLRRLIKVDASVRASFNSLNLVESQGTVSALCRIASLATTLASVSATLDLKELRKLRLEAVAKRPPIFTPVDSSTPSSRSSIAPEPTPEFTISESSLCKLSPNGSTASWKALESHRAKLRQSLIKVESISADMDPVLTILLKLKAVPNLIRYVSQCVQPACALQAFIALTPWMLDHKDSSSLLAATLSSKLVHEPETVSFLVTHFYSGSPDKASGIFLASARSPSFGVSSVARSRSAAALATLDFLKLTKFALAMDSADGWMFMQNYFACGFAALGAGDAQAVILGAVEILRKRSSLSVPALNCLAALAKLKTARPVFARLKILDFLIGEIDAEADLGRIGLRLAEIPVCPVKVDVGKKGVPLLKLGGLASMQGASSIGAVPAEELTRCAVVNDTSLLCTFRNLREVYRKDDLHAALLIVIFNLLLTPKRQILDDHFSDSFPSLSGRLDYLGILQSHLNHSNNAGILSLLAPVAAQHGFARLLKLIVHRFSFDWIRESSTVLGGGAFGTVLKAVTKLGVVAMKVLPVDRNPLARSHLYSAYSEVTALHALTGSPGIVPLIDYYNDGTNYVICLKYCETTAVKWRSDKTRSLPEVLEIFGRILSGVKRMHERGVVHYDLKGDNILIDSGRVFIADFGEARILEGDSPCMQNRGTECIKSPEMLALANSVKKEGITFDRRRPVGTTAVSDVWSLGCLLYELVTGCHLFASIDWVQFFVMVTGTDGRGVLTEKNEEALSFNKPLISFIKFLLVTDPSRRPDIDAVYSRFPSMYAEAVTASCSLPSVPSEVLIHDEAFTSDCHLTERRFYLDDSKGSYQVFSDCYLVLVKDIFEASSNAVIDCRQSSDLKSSRILRVLHFDGDLGKVIAFTRACVFKGGSLQVVDDADSVNGQGFKVLVFLAKELMKMTVYQAFSFVVSSCMIPVSSNALSMLSSISKVHVESSGNVSCPCGAWRFSSPNAPAFKSLHKLPAIADCACGTGFCPNQGRCMVYWKWVDAEFGLTGTSRWLVVQEKLKVGAFACRETVEAVDGVECRLFRCSTCKVITHGHLTRIASGEFLASTVLLQERLTKGKVYERNERIPSLREGFELT